MSTTLRRLAGAAAVLALAGPLSVAMTSSASAAPASSCYASGCTGLDPSRTSCQYDAETVATSASGETGIELRYSPSCRAAWARVVNGGYFHGTIAVHNSRGQSYSASVPGSGTYFTRMVDDAGITSYASFGDQDGYDSTPGY